MFPVCWDVFLHQLSDEGSLIQWTWVPFLPGATFSVHRFILLSPLLSPLLSCSAKATEQGPYLYLR